MRPRQNKKVAFIYQKNVKKIIKCASKEPSCLTLRKLPHSYFLATSQVKIEYHRIQIKQREPPATSTSSVPITPNGVGARHQKELKIE